MSSLERSSKIEKLLPLFVDLSYKLLAVLLMNQPNGQLTVTVNNSQLRTMASETVDLVDLPLTPTLYSTAVPLEHHLHMRMCPTNQECSLWDSIPGPLEHWATALPMRKLIVSSNGYSCKQSKLREPPTKVQKEVSF